MGSPGDLCVEPFNAGAVLATLRPPMTGTQLIIAVDAEKLVEELPLGSDSGIEENALTLPDHTHDFDALESGQWRTQSSKT